MALEGGDAMKKRMDGRKPSRTKANNNQLAFNAHKPFEYVTDAHKPVDQEFEFIQAADRIKRRGYVIYLDDTGREIVRYRARRW